MNIKDYKSAFSYRDVVESVTLPVVTYFPHDTLEDWVRMFTREWNVEITFDGSSATDGLGVKVRGQYVYVKGCIANQWGSNETSETMEAFVNMMLGDRLAETLWNEYNAVNPHSRPSMKFSWDAHFNEVGFWDDKGQSTPKNDQAMEWAIEVLSALEYDMPFSGDSPTDFAQSYLSLAVAHCPRLFNIDRQMIAKSMNHGPEYVTLDAFNLFVGAAFMYTPNEDEGVWVVMDFKDGGEGAASVAEEKVLVRLRRADNIDNVDDVQVRDWTFDYMDKIYLVGSVRCPNDLDDNNWGQN